MSHRLLVEFDWMLVCRTGHAHLSRTILKDLRAQNADPYFIYTVLFLFDHMVHTEYCIRFPVDIKVSFEESLYLKSRARSCKC